MDTIIFWAPIVLLFLSAFIAAIVKLRTKDICLKKLSDFFCLIKTPNNRWLWGDLRVFADAIELTYSQAVAYDQKHAKVSYLLYKADLSQVQFIARPVPKKNSEDYLKWKKELAAIHNPSFARKTARKIRNLFNLLRDAFSQTLTAIIGVLTRNPKLQNIAGNASQKRFNEMGQTVIGSVPNSYEHVLEHYLGEKVVCESMRDGKLVEDIGILQEYSSKYLLLRGVILNETIPEDFEGFEDDAKEFDLILPRGASVVRHLAKSM